MKMRQAGAGPQATNAKDHRLPQEPGQRPGTYSPSGPPEGTSPANACIWARSFTPSRWSLGAANPHAHAASQPEPPLSRP